MNMTKVTAVLPPQVKSKIAEVSANPSKCREFFSEYASMNGISLAPVSDSEATLVKGKEFFNERAPFAMPEKSEERRTINFIF